MAEEEEAASVHLIGTRFAHDVDDAGSRPSHFRGEAVGNDLEFLNSVLGKIRQSAAHDFVVVIGAVHRDVSTTAECAGGRYFKGVGFGGIKVRCRTVSGQQISQLQKIAAVQRDTRYGFGRNLPLYLRLSQFHSGGATIDHYYFPDLLQAERGIQRHSSPDFEINIVIFARGEPLGLHSDLIRSGGKVRDCISSVVSRNRLACVVGRGIGDSYLGSGDEPSIRIDNGSIQSCGGKLCPSDYRYKRECCDQGKAVHGRSLSEVPSVRTSTPYASKSSRNSARVARDCQVQKWFERDDLRDRGRDEKGRMREVSGTRDP